MISIRVPAVSISSSTMIARRPRTSPMTLITSARSRLPWRRFSTIARGASSSSANCPGALGEPEVGDDDAVVELHVEEVAAEHVDRGELVDRDVEEPLDLALVEVHRQHPVGAGDGDHVGDEAGGDRDARLVLLVGAAVGVVRDHRRDPPGGRPLEGVDHDQELHDRLVDRAARWAGRGTRPSRGRCPGCGRRCSRSRTRRPRPDRAPTRASARSSGPAPGWRSRGRSRTGPRTRRPPVRRRRS